MSDYRQIRVLEATDWYRFADELMENLSNNKHTIGNTHDLEISDATLGMNIINSYHETYPYLYLATRFGAYQKNRSGFQKLYKELSDKHFDEAIDLIKHINKRGVSINMLEIISNSKEYKKDVKFYSLDKDELHSLGIALDIEKELFEKAANVTNHAIHDIDNTEKNGRHTKHYKHRDPEFAHYFEEKFLGSQAETVRKLSGYFNDLLKIVRDEQQELGFYMFDEYLQKQ
ncbi:ferritin-1, chloroplastic-like [Teleopsis dalmanni]|uniref:ferritin-1, chloroplastic-like n=1 Tax=Teleopsis dalmanni TaxID=139649 RepID=UPI0018CE2B7E|nr:ferritin-1, chloroplastic-like [Teleopsis dalmanni]